MSFYALKHKKTFAPPFSIYCFCGAKVQRIFDIRIILITSYFIKKRNIWEKYLHNTYICCTFAMNLNY